ncbi:MAG: SIMPL domain-containing protein [Dehalococcoidia bacterium]
MKKSLLMVVSLVLVASVLLVGCGSDGDVSAGKAPAYFASQEALASLVGDGLQQTGLWVTGTGRVAAVPDVVILRLGVEAQQTTVTEAQSNAAAAMAGIMAALSANGVAERDVQTQRFSITAVTKWVEDSREQITIGYKVTNIVNAKIRDMDKAGSTIDAVAEAGGDLTRIEAISFTVDDPTAYYNEAREEALLDAMAKAQQIAPIVGVTLGKPIYITESGGPVPPPYPRVAYAEGLDVGTSISPGEMDISVTVQIVYAIQ